MSRSWAKASACRLQVSLSCAVLCQIVPLQYLSRSSLHRLAWFLSRVVFSCRIIDLHMGTRKVYRLSLSRLQDHLIVLTLLIISVTFVPSSTHMLVFLSLYVLLSIRLSILVCVAASLFSACVLHVRHWLVIVPKYGSMILRHAAQCSHFKLHCYTGDSCWRTARVSNEALERLNWLETLLVIFKQRMLLFHWRRNNAENLWNGSWKATYIRMKPGCPSCYEMSNVIEPPLQGLIRTAIERDTSGEFNYDQERGDLQRRRIYFICFLSI